MASSPSLDDAVAILASDPRVEFVLLYGSKARQEARPGSDVDIAVGLDVEPGSDLLAVRLELAGKVSHVPGRLDLVVASEAPPALAYRIARDASVLFCRDPRAVTRFRARAYLVYFDWMQFLRPHSEAMLGRIDGGTYGG